VPTYQYACTDCGDRVEVVQKFSDEPLSVCASCGSRLRKVFSPVGIVFKGSGFYRTDSRAGQKTPEPATASSNGSDTKNLDAGSSGGDKPGGDKPGSDKPGSDKSGSDKPGRGGKKAGEAVGSGSSSSPVRSPSSSSGSKVA